MNKLTTIICSVAIFVSGFLIGQSRTEKYYDPIVKEVIGWEYGETNLTYTCQHLCESEFEKMGC